MNRNQLIFIDKWLKDANRKPLVIRGARQVGKSTLVKLAAEQLNLPLALINLERFPELNASFQSLDLRAIINELEALPGIGDLAPNSLLFLDEIQAVPEAIPALRYFYEDMPEIPLLSAGSLLEFVLSDHKFSMPVGRVQYLHMGPMTFTEFLEALGEIKLKNEIDTYELGKDIGLVVHQRLSKLLRSYYFVGGMPEAVAAFVRSQKFKEVSAVHHSIIDTYRDDFPKYAGARNLSRMVNVFNFAARNVGKKVKYSNISKHDQSATIKKDIELLCMARVVSKVIHSHCSGLPLQADLEETVFKLLFLDVGLMNSISGLNLSAISQMEDIQLINEGPIAEQFIGQHLQALLSSSLNRELTYWLREGKASNAETDFVVSFDGRIIPIEVKSGSSGSLKSLHQFVGEKQVSTAIRFDSCMPSTQRVNTSIQKAGRRIDVDYHLISLPLYLVERLPELIETLPR